LGGKKKEGVRVSKFCWVYYITDSIDEKYKQGDIVFLDFYAGKFMEKFTKYDVASKKFYKPLKGILVAKIENTAHAKIKILKNLFFDAYPRKWLEVVV